MFFPQQFLQTGPVLAWAAGTECHRLDDFSMTFISRSSGSGRSKVKLQADLKFQVEGLLPVHRSLWGVLLIRALVSHLRLTTFVHRHRAGTGQT